MSAPPPGIPNPFVLSDTNKLGNSMAKAGFIDMRTDTVIVALNLRQGKIILVTVKQLALLPVLHCLERLKKEEKTSGERWQKKRRGIMEPVMAI